MAPNQLSFAKGQTFVLAFVFSTAAAMLLGIGLDFEPGDRIRFLGLLYLFGPHGPGVGAFVLAAMSAVMTLAALGRLFNGRPAAAIRYDGLELNGLFFSRYIPWSAIDQISLRVYRYRGNSNQFVCIDSRCPPGANPLHHFLASLNPGISEQLIVGSPQDMAAWVEKAQAAWNESSRPTRPPLVRNRTGFGRRAA